MNETDDRLAGDLVWELFARPSPERTSPARPVGRWLTVAALIGVGGLLYPPLAVVVACLAVAGRDFRTGRRIARTLSDKNGGRVCARFHYAWGAWKIGSVAPMLMLACIYLYINRENSKEMPPGVLAALLLCIGGFTASSVLAASGVWAAYRSGMRVWVGEGVNRARTLLMGMLIMTFLYGALIPGCLWLTATTRIGPDGENPAAFAVMVFGCMLGGPFAILIILDAIGRRVIADTPGKFGPKVPAVGKWNPPTRADDPPRLLAILAGAPEPDRRRRLGQPMFARKLTFRIPKSPRFLRKPSINTMPQVFKSVNAPIPFSRGVRSFLRPKPNLSRQ